MTLAPEDLSRLLTRAVIHPLHSDRPAHVALAESLARLVDAGLLTAPDLDADPDATHELTPDGNLIVSRMLGAMGCDGCRYQPAEGGVYPERCNGCRWWWPDEREAQPAQIPPLRENKAERIEAR